MGSAHMVSLCSGVSTIRHIVSLVRERGVGTAAGSGAQSFSISLQSELLLEQLPELPAADLLDADRHLFRVELISANVYTTSKRFFTSQ